MVIYVTKETFERYKLKMPEDMSSTFVRVLAQKVIERELGDRLMEWGGKLFYFDGRKCIQVVNFASKLTIFLIDVKTDDVVEVGNMIAQYLFDIYDGNKKMKKALERLFEEHPGVCFSRLHDRSIIATLNNTQRRFLDDGYRLYEFISDGILHTREVNKKVNRNWIFTEKKDGKTNYFFSAERFEQLILERYG